MRILLAILFLLPLSAQASFLFQYGLNYSSHKDSSSGAEFDQSRTFHKLLLGASVNNRKTLFLGWNINSWSSSLSQGTSSADTYSMTEMGPRLLWFMNENFNWYFTADWNPYAKGTRDKSGTNRDITGSSTNFGVGYRFRISRLMGVGASIQYHTLSLDKETIGSTESNVSAKVTNLMPMLEFSILTK